VIYLGTVYADLTVEQAGAHDFHELVYLVDGQYETTVEGRRQNAAPGSVYYYPPGLPHSVRLVRGQLYVLQWREPAPPAALTVRPRRL
jgi:mannose-6-phosphate isomerase-like protein (cupin superfamily)